MANTDIVLAKGAFSVTINDVQVEDNFSNKLFVITPVQSPMNQASGPTPAKIVDLIRVTHTVVIKGYISPTSTSNALVIKQNLVNIWKGAGTAGGVVSLTYDYNAKASGDTSATATNPILGYIEKVNFTDKAMDEPSDMLSNPELYTNIAKFEVAITFIEGTQV